MVPHPARPAAGASPSGPDGPAPALPDVAREKFRTLPEPVRPQDMIASHAAAPAPDPSPGRDSEIGRAHV